MFLHHFLYKEEIFHSCQIVHFFLKMLNKYFESEINSSINVHCLISEIKQVQHKNKQHFIK